MPSFSLQTCHLNNFGTENYTSESLPQDLEGAATSAARCYSTALDISCVARAAVHVPHYMSETRVAVLGAGLPKISILNILLAQSPVFQEHAFPKRREPSVCSCRLCCVCSAAFQLAGMRHFGGVQRDWAHGVRHFSAFFGIFRRFKARFSAFRHMHAAN